MVVSTLSDTSPEAMRVLIDAYRRMPLERKWRNITDACRTSRALHACGVRHRQPDATRKMIENDWRMMALGPLWQSQFAEAPEMDESSLDWVPFIRKVADALTDLGVGYALGGSWASSVLGIERTTRDADLSAEPFPGLEAAFVAKFGSDYFVSLEAVREAVARRSCFNVIHPASGFKVDVFVQKDTPFARSTMSRRWPAKVPGADKSIDMLSAEDVVLHKLEWFRLGGEIAEQQWRDILGVLRVQAGNLDEAYLDHWAGELNVLELLAKARADAVI